MHSGMNAVAKVRFEFGMVDEGLGPEIGIACTDVVDQRPQRRCIGQGRTAAGKISATIGERQRDAQIQADQRIVRQIVAKKGEDVLARPTPAGFNQNRRPAIGVRKRERYAFLNRPLGT